MTSPPFINWPAFCDDELPSGRLLWQNLCTLSYHITLFQHAVSLADYCDTIRAPHRAVMLQNTATTDLESLGKAMAARELNSQFIKWKQLAARDGAITLYNFAETKQTVEKLKGRCPSILPYIDKAKAKEANLLFDNSFPGLADVRLSVAHSGKLFKSEDERSRHTVPGSNTSFIAMQTDRDFASSINGKMASYSLTTKTSEILERVLDLIYQSYEPAARKTQELPRRAHPKTDEQPQQD